MRRADVPGQFKAALQLHQAGELARAESIYREIVQVDRYHADAMHYLGLALHQTRRSAEAIDAMLKSLERSPNNAVYHANLANVYHGLKRYAESAEHALRATQLQPSFAEAHHVYGLALRGLGQLEAAEAAYRRVITLQPKHVHARNNLASVLVKSKRFAEAITAAMETLALAPNLAETHHNLGRALAGLGRFDEAMAAHKRAIELRPDFADAWSSLGEVYQDLGQLDQTIIAYGRADEFEPGQGHAGSNRLFVLNYADGIPPQQLFDEHIAWARRHAEPLSSAGPPPAPIDRNPQRPLRVGYVSGDFRAHSVATFLEPLIAAHDPTQVEITCYAHQQINDHVTKRFGSYATRWRDIALLDDVQADELIRRDQIDILIDLTGHAGKHRLTLFARRPAPVQIAYLGWQNTTGMREIDFRITDVHLDPPGMTEQFHTERLLRLPETVAVYQPPDPAPDVAPLPAMSNECITFGSFSRLEKVTPSTLARWSRALARVPASRLIMFADALVNAHARDRVLDALRNADRDSITPDRIELLGSLRFQDYLAAHARIDVVLDTFPFNGHTTACHGLWMGVPPLTLAGDRYSSRMGLSVMTNLGLPQFITTNEEEFVDRASSLASDIESLAAIRAGMRDRMRASALMNGPRLARNFESLLREAVNSMAETAGSSQPAPQRRDQFEANR